MIRNAPRSDIGPEEPYRPVVAKRASTSARDPVGSHASAAAIFPAMVSPTNSFSDVLQDPALCSLSQNMGETRADRTRRPARLGCSCRRRCCAGCGDRDARLQDGRPFAGRHADRPRCGGRVLRQRTRWVGRCRGRRSSRRCWGVPGVRPGAGSGPAQDLSGHGAAFDGRRRAAEPPGGNGRRHRGADQLDDPCGQGAHLGADRYVVHADALGQDRGGHG